MSSEDPFLEVQTDVRSLLSQTRHLFSSYLRIRSLSSTSSKSKSSASGPSTELLQSRAEVTSNLETLTNDLADLLDAVRAVESDPYRFGLDVAEVQRRKAFVREVTDEVEAMRKELQSSNLYSVTGTPAAATGLPDPDAFSDEDGDAYEAFEQQQQQTMMREQDEQLDGVFRSVGVLRGQAEDMGRELEEQGHMLDEVDTLADRVGGKLQSGTKKIAEVIRRNEDAYSSCCIGVLIVVLIILLILVIII